MIYLLVMTVAFRADLGKFVLGIVFSYTLQAVLNRKQLNPLIPQQLLGC